MFGVKFNLHFREVIIVSPDSETDRAANGYDLLCMTKNLLEMRNIVLTKAKPYTELLLVVQKNASKKTQNVSRYNYWEETPGHLDKGMLLGSIRDLTKLKLGLQKFVKPAISTVR